MEDIDLSDIIAAFERDKGYRDADFQKLLEDGELLDLEAFFKKERD